MGSFVNGPGVVRAVGGYGRNGVENLLQQWRDSSAVMRSASGQIRGDDLTRRSIHSEVELAPSPVSGRVLDMPDVNSESCTVDEYVNRLTRRELTHTDLTKFLQTPRQRGMIGDREVDLEHIYQATKEALGLAKRKMEDHANRQRGLDRNVTVGVVHHFRRSQ